MAATRRMTEMVENNRHLLYITDRQLTKLRADIRNAKRIAFEEYNRLDRIIRSGSLARAEYDVEALRMLHSALHPDERLELLEEEAQTPPNDTASTKIRKIVGGALIVGVVYAISFTNAFTLKDR